MKPPPTFQYLKEPGGPVHLRVSRSIRTLCGLTPTEAWEELPPALPEAGFCQPCNERLARFLSDIMEDGNKPP